jgi:hypothetical protein
VAHIDTKGTSNVPDSPEWHVDRLGWLDEELARLAALRRANRAASVLSEQPPAHKPIPSIRRIPMGVRSMAPMKIDKYGKRTR